MENIPQRLTRFSLHNMEFQSPTARASCPTVDGYDTIRPWAHKINTNVEAIKVIKEGKVHLCSNSFLECLHHHSDITFPAHGSQLRIPFLGKAMQTGVDSVNVLIQHGKLGSVSFIDATAFMQQIFMLKLANLVLALKACDVRQVQGAGTC